MTLSFSELQNQLLPEWGIQHVGDGPDVDLLVRTAGEMRVSNFLLWQISYAELWVTDVCWPDFTEAHLDAALAAFAARDRKFGGLSPS